MSFINVGIFSFGMFAQAFSVLLGKWQNGDGKKLLLSFAMGLLGMVPGKNEHHYDLNLHLFFSCMWAASVFTSMFKYRLISRIGVRTILVLNILLLFLVYDKFGVSYLIFGVLFIPTLITLMNGFSDLDQTFGWQVFFYVWFSVVLVSIGLLHFGYGDLFKTFGFNGETGQVDPFNLFFTGGAFLYILSNAWYVIMLIPVTGKHQSMENRMKNIREHMQLLAYGYIWEKGDVVGNIVTVIIFPLILILNYKFGFWSESLFVSIILVFLPFFASRFSGINYDDGVGSMPETAKY